MAKGDTLIVDRSRWLTGSVVEQINEAIATERRFKTNFIESSLHDPATKLQCCLGFGCRQVGMTVESIKHASLPEYVISLPRTNITTPLRRLLNDSGLCERLAEVNDSSDYSDEKRERKIKELAKTVGVKVKFIGRYPSETKIAQLVDKFVTNQ